MGAKEPGVRAHDHRVFRKNKIRRYAASLIRRHRAQLAITISGKIGEAGRRVEIPLQDLALSDKFLKIG
jgi:hypothetical protein